METIDKIKQNSSYGVSKHPHFYAIQNTNPCESMKIRAVIGGWTEYYTNHGNAWARFNVHGETVHVMDNCSTSDYLTFRWQNNTLNTTTGGLFKSMTLIDNWLKIR